MSGLAIVLVNGIVRLCCCRKGNNNKVLVGAEILGWWGVGVELHLILHCHQWNDFCIKMGSSMSHFNV